MLANEFDEVAWQEVYAALHDVPRMFAIWACKQTMGVAGKKLLQSKYKHEDNPMCPSCGLAEESCARVLSCSEEGRVDAFIQSIVLVDNWMKKVGTETGLRKSIIEFVAGCGGVTMMEITIHKGPRFGKFATSQDISGWRKFMEGMISKEPVEIQWCYVDTGSGTMAAEDWEKFWSSNYSRRPTDNSCTEMYVCTMRRRENTLQFRRERFRWK